jgi:hypothetical protein
VVARLAVPSIDFLEAVVAEGERTGELRPGYSNPYHFISVIGGSTIYYGSAISAMTPDQPFHARASDWIEHAASFQLNRNVITGVLSPVDGGCSNSRERRTPSAMEDHDRLCTSRSTSLSRMDGATLEACRAEVGDEDLDLLARHPILLRLGWTGVPCIGDPMCGLRSLRGSERMSTESRRSP